MSQPHLGRLHGLILVLATPSLAVPYATAQTTDWLAPAGGSYFTAGNWSSGEPDRSTTAIFDLYGANPFLYQVDFCLEPTVACSLNPHEALAAVIEDSVVFQMGVSDYEFVSAGAGTPSLSIASIDAPAKLFVRNELINGIWGILRSRDVHVGLVGGGELIIQADSSDLLVWRNADELTIFDDGLLQVQTGIARSGGLTVAQNGAAEIQPLGLLQVGSGEFIWQSDGPVVVGHLGTLGLLAGALQSGTGEVHGMVTLDFGASWTVDSLTAVHEPPFAQGGERRASSGALGAGASVHVLSGSTLDGERATVDFQSLVDVAGSGSRWDLTGDYGDGVGLRIGAGSGSVSVQDGGIVAVNQGLRVTGAGSLVLGPGGTVRAGSLILDPPGQSSEGGAPVQFNGGTLEIDGGTIDAAGQLLQIGSGSTMRLINGAAGPAGDLHIGLAQGPGLLEILSNSSLNSAGASIGTGGELRVDGAGATWIPGTVSVAGGLVGVTGGATMSANTIDVVAGTVTGNGSQLISGAAVVVGGGTSGEGALIVDGGILRTNCEGVYVGVEQPGSITLSNGAVLQSNYIACSGKNDCWADSVIGPHGVVDLGPGCSWDDGIGFWCAGLNHSGELRVGDGAWVDVEAIIMDAGDILLDTPASTITATIISGGALRGAGTIAGQLLNTAGHVTPYRSDTTWGDLTVNGFLTQGAAGQLDVFVDPALDDAAGVVVNGTATLGGRLEVIFLEPPTPGQQYTILEAAEIVGAFDQIVVSNSAEVVVSATTVTVEALPIADCNDNGIDDAIEIFEGGGLGDCDRDGVLDDCQEDSVDCSVHNLTAGTWHMTIQGAIEAAKAGDEIVVAPGTYPEVVFINRPLLLRSSDGPAATVITAGGALGTVEFDADGITLDGFTLRSTCPECPLTSALLVVSRDAGLVRNCTFDQVGGGSGAMIINSVVEVADCTFTGLDITMEDASALAVSADSQVTVKRCRFAGNATDSSAVASAIHVSGVGSLVSVASCVFEANDSIEIVVDVLPSPADIRVHNSLFVRSDFAATFISSTVPLEVSSCTFVSELVSSLALPAEASVSNSVASSIGQTIAAVTFSCNFDGDPADGNITANPMFVDQSGGDYHLDAGSPCVDAGGPLPADVTDLDEDGDLVEPLPLDLDGLSRTFGLAPDMGAYERQCAADADGSGSVGVEDMVIVILEWGCQAPPACAGDVNGDGVVDIGDLVTVVIGWGSCD